MHGNSIIGICRETKSKWERRCPISPEDARYLIQEHGIRVIIQPSSRRVYPDSAFVSAGAEISEDLSKCGTVLAVKEVPIKDLLDDRTYLFFSHTIKAQPYNMNLLDALIEKRIRMIDYETITEDGSRGGNRLVAFGYYAGVAGAVGFLRGLGERLLSLGFSTPFLHVGSMYSYANVASAFAAVKSCGESIAEFGLPPEICPLIVVITGNGKVASGSLEVWKLLPHEIVDPFSLRELVSSKVDEKNKKVYISIATAEHMVQRIPEELMSQSPQLNAVSPPTSPRSTSPRSSPLTSSFSLDVTSPSTPEDVDVNCSSFDKKLYKEHPEQFQPIFHIKVAPYASVICNCMYWDDRFPRLLTNSQTRELATSRRLRLLGITDISCDFKGSIEFLREFTSIEKPFIVYDAENDVFHESLDFQPGGILFHAIDHLPSECPRDASDYFSSVLRQYLSLIAKCKCGNDVSIKDQFKSLPVQLSGAIITINGELAPNFKYIAALREAAEKIKASRGLRRSRNESFMTVILYGHLFDTLMLNKALDLIEDKRASAHIIDFKVGRDRSAPTELRLQIIAPQTGQTLESIIEDLSLIAIQAGVELKFENGNGIAFSKFNPDLSHVALSLVKPVPVNPRLILILGSGFVAGPCVTYLLKRNSANKITLASMIFGEAKALADQYGSRVTPIVLDVESESKKIDGGLLGDLITNHDIVISLVPAFLHASVARLVIKRQKHMLTASYVSAEMESLDEEARKAGVIILNEGGLDPGIDHMCVCRIVDDIHSRGGLVTSFISSCGGLPAPEAADNPLGYKFTWSPRGALLAMMNGAHFREDSTEVTISPGTLLSSVSPFRLASSVALALESLPNRDAFVYISKYGLDSENSLGKLHTMKRNTLRYAGFSKRLEILANLGLLSSEPREFPFSTIINGRITLHVFLSSIISKPAVIDTQLDNNNNNEDNNNIKILSTRALVTILANDYGSKLSFEETDDFLNWLGPEGAITLVPGPRPFTFLPLDTIAGFLSHHPGMILSEGERDIAVMQHEIQAEFPNGTSELHTSALLEFGTIRDNESGKKSVETAMSRTVGITAATAAALLLERGSEISPGGVFTPTSANFYVPILEMLKREGIAPKESVQIISK